MNEIDVHMKEKFKQKKRIPFVPFMPAENLPEWIAALTAKKTQRGCLHAIKA